MYNVRFKSHHDASRLLKNKFDTNPDKQEYLAGLLSGPALSKRAVYLHVPFCNKICSFCPFHRPDRLKRREYDEILISEIESIRGYEYMKAPIDAINFGGGTPTALSPRQMGRVLRALRDSFDIKKGAEISVETSIIELTDEMTSVLIECGVNRLSVGVQTFDDKGRKLLGRRGSGAKAAQRLADTLKAGITNLGVDLIYNYPGETEEVLTRDLEIIKSLGLAGVSFYSLMLYEKTPLFVAVTDAERVEMNDLGREKIFFDMITGELGKAGYGLFELTKLIRNGLDRYDYIRIRHTGGSCIAIGHGAGGNLEDYVYHNGASAKKVSDSIPISAMGRVLSPAYRVMDTFVNDLQKTSADLSGYSARLGVDLNKILDEVLTKMENGGLLVRNGETVKLTHNGVFWGNNIIDEIISAIISNEEFGG